MSKEMVDEIAFDVAARCTANLQLFVLFTTSFIPAIGQIIADITGSKEHMDGIENDVQAVLDAVKIDIASIPAKSYALADAMMAEKRKRESNEQER